MEWNTINQAVVFIGVVSGIYYTYRQLRDKKPRLSVEFERSYFPNPGGDTPPGSIAHPTPNLTIRLRNPTERAIKIEKTSFVDGRKRIFVLPGNWKTVSEIPAQDHRTIVVSVPEFDKWSKEVKMFRPEKGRFVLVDGIGKEHKSLKVGDSLSMTPTKLP